MLVVPELEARVYRMAERNTNHSVIAAAGKEKRWPFKIYTNFCQTLSFLKHFNHTWNTEELLHLNDHFPVPARTDNYCIRYEDLGHKSIRKAFKRMTCHKLY